MTTTYTTKVRATPGGEITLTAAETVASAYGPVEIAWYPDRLEITAFGAGRAVDHADRRGPEHDRPAQAVARGRTGGDGSRRRLDDRGHEVADREADARARRADQQHLQPTAAA